MRRLVLLLAAMALALLLASGMAWALNEVGTDGPDTLRGDQQGRQPLGCRRQRRPLRVGW